MIDLVHITVQLLFGGSLPHIPDTNSPQVQVKSVSIYTDNSRTYLLSPMHTCTQWPGISVSGLPSAVDLVRGPSQLQL